jgi:hypothetical protein
MERSPEFVEQLRWIGRILYTNVRASSGLAQPDSGTALHSPFSLEEIREAVAAALR